MEFLWETARKALEANSVKSREGRLTVAGGHQFKTFWVRDFCFSVPGLLALGHVQPVRSQIEICYRYQRKDGLIARGFDVVNPKLRVAAQTIRYEGKWDYANRNLKAEYLGEHGTPAVDSCLLTLLASLQWMEKSGNRFFLENYSGQMERAFQFILNSREGDLLTQPAFSDWQDSARRKGETFYLNLLFVRVLERLQNLDVKWAALENLETWKRRLWDAFYDGDTGLFFSQTGHKQYSLETILWCIEEDTFHGFIARETLWKNLVSSPLWSTMPGRPVDPEYPARDVSWSVKLVGLRHYHDRFYWSWLMAESLKVALLMNAQDEVTRIANELEKLARTHGTIHEIYEVEGSSLIPVKRALYRSEFPFSWGAAKILEALATQRNAPPAP